MKRRILPLILALVLVLSLGAPAYAADDPLSFADAVKGSVKPHLDGKAITVTSYVDSYVAKPNSPEQKIAVYVPDGATKAVIRYLRYNKDILPAGDPERIVISGTSGGGALSAVIAASGNSSDYYESLYEIGAAGVPSATASTISDDVFATIAWCPINDLGRACAAYEWTYNETRKTMYAEGAMDYTVQSGMGGGSSEWPNATQEAVMAASEALKADYAAYVNSLGLKLDNGAALTDKNLQAAIVALMEAEIKDTLAEGATPESMLSDIKAALWGGFLFEDLNLELLHKNSPGFFQRRFDKKLLQHKILGV